MEYVIPDGLSADAIEVEAREQWPCSIGSCAGSDVIYYDTFDWAVYADGGVLTLQDHTLRWASTMDATSCSQSLHDEPGLLRGLPPGPVKARIEPLAPLRRLLPLMQITTSVSLIRVLDDNEKTVARIFLDERCFRDPSSGSEGRLAGRLRVEPVRGYDDDLGMVVALLEGKLGLAAADRSPFLEALAAVGRQPADYSAKPDLQLDPNARADQVTKRILLELLDVLEANLEGAKQAWDTEFLHDLRVATRRTRSALTQVKGVFPEAVVERTKTGLAWLQRVTGPVRDLDVYLLAFDDYRAALPEELRPKLQPLLGFLHDHHASEQTALAEALGGTELERLIQEWRDFLVAPVPAESELPNAMRPVKLVADARIRRMAKRVRREGRAIRDDSPAEDLHELRKSCKKLRYLMELFKSLYGDDEIKSLIKQLKVLLDQLGAFQDLAVQARHLESMAEQMQREGRADTRLLLSMGALIGDLLRRQVEARGRFAEIFTAFDEPTHWAQYRALFWGSEAERLGR